MRARSWQALTRMGTLVGVLLAWDAARAAGPPGRLSFVTYGPEVGVGKWNIWSIGEDAGGVIWLGTDAGVFRYDGSRFQPVPLPPEHSSVVAHTFVKAPSSDLWAFTLSHTARWHEGRWETLDERWGLGRIRNGTTDGQGRLWLTTDSGLFWGREGAFEVVPGSPGGRAFSITIDPGGAAYLVMEGVVHRRSADGHWQSWGGLPQECCANLDIDSTGRLWFHNGRRLWMMSRDGSILEKSVPVVEGAWINRFLRDRHGTLWLGSTVGLLRIDPGEDPRLAPGVPGNRAKGLLEDQYGHLWVGGAGLHRLAGRGVWQSYTQQEGLPHDEIWAVRRDDGGTLWAGTRKGLARMTSTGWMTEPGVPPEVIHDILPADGGTLWLGATSDILHYDPGTGALTRFALDFATNEPIFRLGLDAEGAIWAATRVGAFRSAGAGAALRFDRLRLPGERDSDRVLDVLADSRGRVWLATGGGIVVRDEAGFRRFTETDGLKVRSIECLAERRDGTICASYEGMPGVACFGYDRRALGGFVHYGTDDGLRSAAYSLGVDREDRLWVGTGHGVTVIGDQIRSFSTADGMPGDDVDMQAFWADDDGDVWIGTSTGLGRFLGSRDVGPPPPPTVRLASVLAGGKEMLQGADLTVPHHRSTLELHLAVPALLGEPRIERQVRLVGTESDFRSEESLHLRYPALAPGRYEFQARARYPRSAWGPAVIFTFSVSPPWWRSGWFLLTSVGVVSALVLLAFRMRQEALRRRNAELEALVAERTAELRDAQARLVQLARQATEQKMAGGFAHEMRNALTGAKLLLGKVLREGGGGARTTLCGLNDESLIEIFTWAKERASPEERRAIVPLFRSIDENNEQVDTILRDIDEALGRALATTRNILDYARVGREGPGVEPVRLCALAGAIAAALEADRKEHGIALTIQIDPDLVVPGKESHYASILENLVRNARDAVLDGGAAQPKAIRIEAASTPAQLVLRVQDTGPGIPAELRERIFEPFFSTRPETGTGLGLSVVQRLVNLYSGAISIESAPGHGTTFTISLPFTRLERDRE